MTRKIIILLNILIQLGIQGMEIEATEKIDFYELTKRGYMFSMEIPKSKIEKNEFISGEFTSIVSEKIKQDLVNKYVIKNIFFRAILYRKDHVCFVYLQQLELDNNDVDFKKYNFYNGLPFILSNNQVLFFSDDSRNDDLKIVPLNKKTMISVCVIGLAIAYLILKIEQKINQDIKT